MCRLLYSDSGSRGYESALSERVRFFKYTEKGWGRMCEVTDQFWVSGYIKGFEESFMRGFEESFVREYEKGIHQEFIRTYKKGRKAGIYLTRQAQALFAKGETKQEIARELKVSPKEVAMMLE